MVTTQPLNLANLEDDRLVLLHKRFRDPTALRELMLRHEGSMRASWLDSRGSGT